jgi:hypothetical protein
MSDMRSIIEKLTAIAEDRPSVGDGVYLEFGNMLEVDTEIMEMSGDSITLLGDERLFKVLESLNDAESKHGSPYDRGRADSYYGRRHNPHKLVPNAHGGHEHEKLTDPSEVEAYSKGYRENTDKKDYGESVVEGEIVSLQDNPQTLKRLAKMWWHGDEAKHAQAVKMLSNMGWDIDEDDDDIVLIKGDEEIRFFMDDLYEEMVSEAEYHGRKVPLGKPMRGDVAKKKVYVKDPKTGNVKKINFGQKGVKIKKNNPARRKSFRARHNCKTAKDRTTARYWSCRAW